MRLIDADAFRWWVDDWYDCTELGQIVTEWINDRPTIEAEPVRRGRWIEGSKISVFDLEGVETWAVKMTCSECSFSLNFVEAHTAQYNYCPNCGARMGEQE